MLVEELLVLFRRIQQAPLRDIQVAQCTDVTRIRGRNLAQQITPAP